MRARASETVRPELIEDERVRTLLTLVGEWGPNQDIAARVIEEAEDADLRTLVARLCTSDHPAVTDDGAAATLALVVQRQKKEAARALQEAIEQASLEGDFERLAELQAEKIRLRSRSE